MEHDVEPKRKLYETSRFTTEVAKTEVGSSTVINPNTPKSIQMRNSVGDGRRYCR